MSKVRVRFAPSPTGFLHVGEHGPRCIIGSLPAITAERLSYGLKILTWPVPQKNQSEAF